MIYGSVISGTHRLVDLVPAFMDVLEQLDSDSAAQIRAEYSDVLDAIDAHTGVLDVEVGEEGSFLLDALDSALNDCAPEGYYFGAHPGDGADFGFWPIDDEYDYAYDDDYDDRTFLDGLDDEDVATIMSWGT